VFSFQKILFLTILKYPLVLADIQLFQSDFPDNKIIRIFRNKNLQQVIYSSFPVAGVFADIRLKRTFRLPAGSQKVIGKLLVIP
jgi:hypothetical protein